MAVKATAEKANVVDKAAVTQEIGYTTTHEEGGPNLSIGQGEEDTTEGANPSTISTHLKWPRVTKRSGPQKKAKASKLDIELITLTEGDLYDIMT